MNSTHIQIITNIKWDETVIERKLSLSTKVYALRHFAIGKGTKDTTGTWNSSIENTLTTPKINKTKRQTVIHKTQHRKVKV